MSIELLMPSNLVLCHSLLLLPSILTSIRVFSISQLFTSDSQSIRVSASVSVLPMNIQDWFPLGLAGLISLQSKGLSSLLQHHISKALILYSAFFMVQLSRCILSHSFKNHGFDYMECYFISLPPPQPSYTPWKNHIPCPSHYSPLLCSISNFHLFTASFLAIYKFPLAPIFKNTEHKKQNLLLNTYLSLVTTLLLCFPSQLNLWKELASSQSPVLHL